MKKSPLFFLQIIFLFILINNKIHSQIVGPNAFIKGLHLEIGIAGSGGYEGTSAVPPAGMHPRGGLGIFGFVADPLLSSWSNFNGDYFTPGTPENGWGIQVGNSSFSPAFSNNCNAPIDILGSISGYTSVLDCRNIFWNGSVTSGTTSIAAKINYFLDQTELYYTTTITFTNNSAATIPMMYYYRNVDPDNNQALSGSYTTQNLIENQPSGACNIACVSASQGASAGSGASYMAFAGLDPEFRVSYGGFANRSGFDIWNGTAGLTGTVGSTIFADEAISIAFRIQNFLPGTSRTFKFVTILGSADKLKAVNNLFSLTYPGSSTVAPVACSPVIPPDTVKICGPTIISVAGPGLTGFTWSWSPTSFLSSSTTFSATVNPPSTTVYTITGIPTNTCVGAPLSYTIVVKPNITSLSITPSATYCPGATILLTASGAGIGGSYSWTGPNSFSSPIQSPSIPSCSLISAGIYTAVITTSAGCIATTTTNVSVLTAISSFSIPISTKCLTGNSFSFINTGTVGGTHSYSFSPSIGAPPSGSTPSYTGSFSAPGTYTVTHTVVSGGCTSISTLTVIVNPMPSVSGTATNASCGLSNGVIVINNLSALGQGPFVFTNNGTAVPSQTITGLGAGTYTLGITNIFGCTFTQTLAVTVTTGPSAISGISTPAGCGLSNGSYSITGVTGGAAAYTYSINGVSTGSVCSGLALGTKTITVRDANGCIYNQTITIGGAVGPTLISGISIPASCGLSNGSYSITGVTGGTAAYTYSINGVSTGSLSSGLSAGVKTITVKDAIGCIYTQTISILAITGPSTASVTTTNATCGLANGSSTVTSVTGGLGPFTYSFDGGAFGVTASASGLVAGTHTVVIKDASLCTYTMTYNILNAFAPTAAVTASVNITCFGLSNGSFTVAGSGGSGGPFSYTLTTPFTVNGTGIFGGLPSGTYNITVKDILGCSTTASVVLTQPSALTLTPTAIAVKCFGTNTGTINIAGSGGTGAYMYQLNGGAFQVSSSYTAVGVGTHTVTIRDANLCTAIQTITVTEPSVLTSTYTSLPSGCGIANGSATISVGGGTPSYTITWNTLPPQTGTIATGLLSGSWLGLITDANGCTLTQTVNVLSAVSPTITGFVIGQPKCFGMSNGSLTVNYSGGTSPYTVSWASPISVIVPGVTVLSHSVTGVAAGVYTVTVMDIYGCLNSMSVSVSQPSLLVNTVGTNTTICYGQSASIFSQGLNGTAPYTYTWTPSILVGPGPHTVSPLAGTSYSVYVTDANGCATSPQIITINIAPQLLISGSSSTRCDGDTALIGPSITSPGTGGPYSYAWNTGSTTASISAIASFPSTPNHYTVTINDGCSLPASAVFTINVNPLPVISFSSNVLSGCAPLALTLTANSSGINDVYYWDNPINAFGNPKSIVFADSGKYTITLVQTNTLTGCKATLTKVNYIEVYPRPIASFIADPQSVSVLYPTINFQNTTQGATSYSWNFGDASALGSTNTSVLTNPNHTYSIVGSYGVFLVATSNKGCKDTAQLVVEVTPDFVLYIPNTFTPDGNGLNDFFLPMGVGIDENNYRMEVYDRWGERVFTSNNFSKGWDGSIKGNKIGEQAVYVYKIIVYDLQGNKHPFVGHITLLNNN
jgi:gliding motility-associated-like protein